MKKIYTLSLLLLVITAISSCKTNEKKEANIDTNEICK